MEQPPAIPPINPQESPLGIVDPTALNELFQRDPLKLSDADVDQIVLYYRAERARFQEAEATGTKPKRVGSPSKAKSLPKPDTTGISLTDLDL